jgi:hypothetical protein
MVRRNGRTFYRSATRIKPPSRKALAFIGFVGGGFLLVAGAPQAAVAIFGIVAIGGWFAWTNRRPLRAMHRSGKRLMRRRPVQHTVRGRDGVEVIVTTWGDRLTSWAEQHRASRS